MTFLVFDAYGGGGVARTVANLANHLVHSRTVRVVSLYRRREHPRFALDSSIELTVLRDLTKAERLPARVAARFGSRLRPVPSEKNMSLLTDVLLGRSLRAITEGVLVSTRPSLHLAATRFARPEVTTVGWDHLNFPSRFANARQREVLRAAVPRLDGYAVLTDADAEDYRKALPATATRIEVLRNSVSWPLSATPAPLDSKVVVAAGRLVPRKGFRRLVRAFAPVARAHPDWQLHIYGTGPQEGEIREVIRRLELSGQVILKGYTHDFPSVLAGASAYAMASMSEGFPMVLIEAMTRGVPLVAFDCPRGPAEIIRDGENGLLVPEGPHERLGEALMRLVEDDELRARLGAQALRDAERYTIDRITADWEDFLDGLTVG
ncbi:MAG: glycosyltransferase family 4 protein [Nocardioidaceae bacterium]|nr:glycosyltransferase family 4 protein [Nocardioidaceae bacterium]NUS51828.1 glycosyltransferase family 4 protein [Nocardioidaceae bacterium]